MPRGSAEQTFVKQSKSRTKSASSSPEPVSSPEPSTSRTHKLRARNTLEEAVQDHRGSTSKRRHVNLPAAKSSTQIAQDCAETLKATLPSRQGHKAAGSRLNSTSTTSSAACLDQFINRERRIREKDIVDALMAAISTCIKRKLDAYEEGDDPNPASSSSSSGIRTKNKSRSTGQKRQRHHEGRDNSEDDDGQEDFRRNIDKKKIKTAKDDTRPWYACPFHQANPQRFKNSRSCCGPGWKDLARLKEHLSRRHALPKFQCLRCCQRFREESQLKAHQRERTPCPVNDSSTFVRDLADGFDQEQEEKLKKRGNLKQPPEERWKEWYRILFQLREDSTDIPSPFYESAGCYRNTPAVKPENVPMIREWFRTEAEPVIREQVRNEVRLALDAVQPDVALIVMERLRDLPRVIFESLKFPLMGSEDSSNAELATQETNDSDLFNFFIDDFLQSDTIDLSQGLEDSTFVAPPDSGNSSELSDSSGYFHTGGSSATSVQSDSAEEIDYTKYGGMPGFVDPRYMNGYGQNAW